MLIGTNSLMEAVRLAYGGNMAEIITGVRHHLAVMGESCESLDHFCLQFNFRSQISKWFMSVPSCCM